jgi:hypothetical protein
MTVKDGPEQPFSKTTAIRAKTFDLIIRAPPIWRQLYMLNAMHKLSSCAQTQCARMKLHGYSAA